MKVLLIDNYDSFTYNLFQYLAELTGEPPVVSYNNQLSIESFEKSKFDAVVISPGPGDPRKAQDVGICLEIIRKANIPLLGVCLGHQAIGVVFGAKVVYAPEVMHGRKSKIYHMDQGLFYSLPQGFDAVRYHSFILSDENFPKSLIKTAWTADGDIMGIQHVNLPIYGVQFHPESIGTAFGKKLLKNFLEKVGKS